MYVCHSFSLMRRNTTIPHTASYLPRHNDSLFCSPLTQRAHQLTIPYKKHLHSLGTSMKEQVNTENTGVMDRNTIRYLRYNLLYSIHCIYYVKDYAVCYKNALTIVCNDILESCDLISLHVNISDWCPYLEQQFHIFYSAL